MSLQWKIYVNITKWLSNWMINHMTTYHKSCRCISVASVKKATVGIIAVSYMTWAVDQLVGNLMNHRDYHLIGMADPTNCHKDLVPSGPQA